MYGIFTYISSIFMVNVGKYNKHRVSGDTWILWVLLSVQKSSMKQIPHQAHSEPQPAVPLRTGNRFEVTGCQDTNCNQGNWWRHQPGKYLSHSKLINFLIKYYWSPNF